MRRLIVTAALVLLVATPAALAKERNLQLLGSPASPKAGQAWNATISVKVDGRLMPGRTPAVRIVSAAGRVISVFSRTTARVGIYRAIVVFPTPGLWRVLVVDRQTGRAYEFKPMRIRLA
jgi:hypothetical protein